MINILMNQKRGLNRFSKQPEDGDPWAPNNLHTPEQKKKKNSKEEQVGKDQEKAQSGKDSHSKNPRWEKTKPTISYLYHKNTP